MWAMLKFVASVLFSRPKEHFSACCGCATKPVDMYAAVAIVLRWHDVIRREHGLPVLGLNDKLSVAAENAARFVCQQNTMPERTVVTGKPGTDVDSVVATTLRESGYKAKQYSVNLGRCRGCFIDAMLANWFRHSDCATAILHKDCWHIGAGVSTFPAGDVCWCLVYASPVSGAELGSSCTRSQPVFTEVTRQFV